MLYIDGQVDLVFNETLMPYIEELKTRKGHGNTSRENGFLLSLPNGMVEVMPYSLSVVYEFETLN